MNVNQNPIRRVRPVLIFKISHFTGGTTNLYVSCDRAGSKMITMEDARAELEKIYGDGNVAYNGHNAHCTECDVELTR